MEHATLQSPTLLNARLHFLDTRLALIHIPVDAVALFIQPLIRLLIHNDRRDESGNIVPPSRPWMFWHPFVHVSLTPDCFVVCPRHEADRLFRPITSSLSAEMKRSVSVSNDDYSAILISGEGLDAGQRVLDLTTPLAAVGISIHFITSYYADFLLVPYSARPGVIQALERRGFVFDPEADGDDAQMINTNSPLLQPGFRDPSASDHLCDPTHPAEPSHSAASDELQDRTLGMLRQHHVSPAVDDLIQLVTCAGTKESTASETASNNAEGKIQLGIIKCLTSPPRFLAITLTDAESVSFTIETRLLANFHNDGANLLLGKDGPEQTAITLDFRDLPAQSTGIVCGVAASLKEGMATRTGDIFNMSYLSSTKAGHVIVYKEELKDALESLNSLELTRTR